MQPAAARSSFLVFLSMGAFWGCGSSSDDSGSGKAPAKRELNMTEELSPPADLTDIKPLSLVSKINSESSFYQISPKSSNGESGNLKHCPAFSESRITASAGFLEIDFSGDLKSCFSGESASPVESFQLEFFSRVECPEDDLSSLNGKTLAEGFEFGSILDFCKQSKKITQFNWTRADSVMNFFGKIHSVSKNGMASTAGKGCELTVQDGLISYGDCIKYHRETQEVLEAPKPSAGKEGLTINPNNKLFTLTMTGLVGDGRSPFFNSGKASFRLNNWVGTMGYTGSDKSPVWSAEGSAELQSGTFYGKTKPTPTPARTPVTDPTSESEMRPDPPSSQVPTATPTPTDEVSPDSGLRVRSLFGGSN